MNCTNKLKVKNLIKVSIKKFYLKKNKRFKNYKKNRKKIKKIFRIKYLKNRKK